MREISAYPYARRYQPVPTAVSFYVFDSLPDSRGSDFDKINAAQGNSMTLEQRSEFLWGSRRYRNPTALVLEKDGFVGLLKAQSNTGKDTAAETIDAFLAFHGLDQLVIHADETGYVALFSHQETTLHVRYFSDDDSAVIHQYGVCSLKSAQFRKRQLQKEAPKPNEDGWRDGSTTEDIGIIVYDHVPILSPNSVRVCVRTERKKPCTFSSEKYLENTSTNAVAEYIRTQFPYSFASSFPSSVEKEKLKGGKPVQFTIRFRGYRSVGNQDTIRDRELRKAYDNGIRHGIHSVLGNIYAVIVAQKQYDAPLEVPLARYA
ncbi:MAG: hypothetical protein AABX82_03255 [Nanoarchaeota archaeon]